MNNKILACIDHSPYSTSVCDYAAWAAIRLGAPLEFIHVLNRHPEKSTAYRLQRKHRSRGAGKPFGGSF